MVEREETGERLYFRFYDPDVLRVFLGAATAKQRQDFFRDITRVVLPTETGDPIAMDASGGSAEERV